MSLLSKFKQRYETAKEVEEVLSQAQEVRDIANLYYINAELVESNPDLKEQFSLKKNEFFNRESLVNNPLKDASDEDTDDEEQEELDEREEERQDDNM